MLRLEPPENVNSIKLTKLETKVLAALKKGKPKERFSHFPEGNDIQGIARIVWGDEVFNCAKRGGHYCSDVTLCYAAKSSLSRVLKKLWQYGLVKRCKPIYHYGWYKPYIDQNGEKYSGFYGLIRELQFLRAISLTETGQYNVEKILFKSLPYHCRVWWILTDRGRKLAEKQGEV